MDPLLSVIKYSGEGSYMCTPKDNFPITGVEEGQTYNK